MKATESCVLTYVLNSLWQVPLVFGAAWAVARVARGASAAFAHRVWVAALLLQVALPAVDLPVQAMFQLVARWWLLAFRHPVAYPGGVVVTTGAGRVQGGLVLAPWLLHGVVCLYAVCVLYFAVRLCVGLWRANGLRKRASEFALRGELARNFARFARVFAVADAALVSSSEIAGPVTVGVWHRVLLLPQGWERGICDEDMNAVLAHEFAHMRRRDFAKNLLYELLSLPVAWHPAVWMTRRRVAESREIVCDALAAEALHGPQRYARSLLRLAAQFSASTHATRIHAIGIFDANHFRNFERRVMRLTEKQVDVRGMRRVVTVAFSMAVATVVCASAMAMRMQVATPQVAVHQQAPAAMPQSFVVALPRPASGQPAQSFQMEIKPDNVAAVAPGEAPAPTRVKALTPVIVEDSPQDGKGSTQVTAGVMAGNVLTKVNPVYPQEAKNQKIQGAVVLNAVIGKDGTIKNLEAVSGPDPLRASALEAVKQWVYRPYLLNGNPVEVETTITVTYHLAE